MRIAIISDIHGNLEALKTTLEDIKKRNVDKIICLGDIVSKGVHLKECIKLVRENCDIILQGNTDEHFSKEHPDLSIYPDYEQTRIKWHNSILTDEDREFLQSLPYSYEFYMSGSLVRLFHATPYENNKAVLVLDSIPKKYEMFLPSEKTISQEVADVVIYGHIHHPFLDKLYNKTLINIGSVGNSFDAIRNENKDSNVLETTRSNYLIIEGELDSKEYTSDISFQFVRVPYDIKKELEDKNLSPEVDLLEYEITNGMYRDMKKINDNYRKIGINPDEI